MNISLSNELGQAINQKVESGRYPSADEVVREALRLLEERDHWRETRLEELRQEIAIGIAQIDRGEYLEYDENTLGSHFEQIKVEGRKRLAAEQGRQPIS